MHELSLAGAIVGIVEEHAAGRRVTRVEVQVGRLRQVVGEALSFAFALTAEGTPAEGAELVLREVPVVGRCLSCGAESSPDRFPLSCGRCGALELQIIGGEELSVEWIEVDEPLRLDRPQQALEEVR